MYSIQGGLSELEPGGEGASSRYRYENHRRMEMTFQSSLRVSASSSAFCACIARL